MVEGVAFDDPISLTARMTAAARARESRRPDRLFDDPWAGALAGPEGVALMNELEAVASPPGKPAAARDNPYIAIRTRCFDDFLLAAARNAAIRQVVLLAAGLDSRAFRLDWPADTRCFELDRADVLHAKDELLEAAGAVPRCARHVIGADLTGDWSEMLLAGGFDAGAPSVWLVEGLTPYLEDGAVRALLARCGDLAARGSRLGIDLASRGIFDSPWTVNYRQALERIGAPWRFGTDEPEALLASAGWEAVVVRPGEPAASFGRWPYPVPPRGTPGIPSFFIAIATRR